MATLSKSGLVYVLTYGNPSGVEIEGIFTSLHKAMVSCPGKWTKLPSELTWQLANSWYQIDATPINERLGGS